MFWIEVFKEWQFRSKGFLRQILLLIPWITGLKQFFPPLFHGAISWKSRKTKNGSMKNVGILRAYKESGYLRGFQYAMPTLSLSNDN